jgi:hypothetical protein
MSFRQLSTCAFLLLQLAATEALAQPAESTRKAALVLADLGWELYSAGRYPEALKTFIEAEAKLHAPSILLMTARSYAKLGRLVEARSVYRRVAQEELPPDAPRAFVKAQSEATEELAVLEPRIPSVEIVVTASAPGAVKLALDGTEIQPSTSVPCDPGEHTVIASIPGYLPVRIAFRTTEGARQRVALDNALLKPLPPEVAPMRRVRESGTGEPDKRLVYTGLAMTGAAAGVGAVFGVLSLLRAGEVDDLYADLEGMKDPDACAGGKNRARCNAVREADEEAMTFGNVAWIGFGSAAVVGAATLVYH